ncbi:MAG: iron ABC transporter [Desulfobacteraceae bacterium 4572_88]|nr:MAG: iron ABC transporter [Desulfobacteraceae bacterium 4572_88]
MLFDIHHLFFCYQEKKIIDDLSLSLEPGKFYGVIGPNGCGKTTFPDLISKQRSPAASGEIIYKGKPISRYSKKALSKEIALVPQNFYINFPFTAKEIVMMGRYPYIPRFSAPSSADLAYVEKIMDATGTSEFEHRLITELSWGERQRVVFARALVQDTPVLILDEATSNFDIRHTIRMLNIVTQGAREAGKTVIAVFQDINMAAIWCDDLIFMKNGKIIAHGPTKTVLDADIIRTVFDVDAKVCFEAYAGAKQVVFRSEP